MTAPGEVRVRRALLSVSDKTAIADFARGLAELGIEIVSTGGTAHALTEAGVAVRSIEDFTGFPEIMGGRVKTLHPKLHAGLLARRDDAEHSAAIEAHGIEYVDLVCVNLYPFERVASQRDPSEAEVIENIDVGGPTMIRAAAKNAQFVAVVVEPESYDAVLQELRDSDGRLSLPTRRSLATRAFACTARYDIGIARWMQEARDDFPELLMTGFEKVLDLPYGENPHQRGAYYAELGARTHALSMIRQLGGRDLSFNNLLDLDGARAMSAEFELPACVIVKHNSPCGVAVANTPHAAYERAFACDPVSAFGGVIAFNRPIDAELADALSRQFIEVLFAPGYSVEALEIITRKPNLRVLEDNERRTASPAERDLKRVLGGLLVQDRDVDVEDRDAMEVVTERVPSEADWGELLFAWRVCKHVRSNAIVLARELATIGIGAGQMSRVDSVRLSLEKARAAGLDVAGAALASDAFFPFADGPELAVRAGVTSIIQPGGSKRDDEVVNAANDAGIAMVFARRRHFRH